MTVEQSGSWAPGFYDDGQENQRWWDGTQWTARVQEAAKPEPVLEPGVLWAATGKPLVGFGGGRYKLTEEYLFFETGTLSTNAQQIHTREIHDVDASQSMTQKARGLGTITLHAQRAGRNEIAIIEDIPNFRDGVALINEVSQRAREDWRLKQSTQHVNYTGMPASAIPAQVAPATPSPADSGTSLNDELGKLAAFHQQGILTDEEFAAAKRKLLGL